MTEQIVSVVRAELEQWFNEKSVSICPTCGQQAPGRASLKIRRKRRHYSVDKLPDELQDAIRDMVEDGKHTYDQIHQHIRALGGDVSRSAIARWILRNDIPAGDGESGDQERQRVAPAATLSPPPRPKPSGCCERCTEPSEADSSLCQAHLLKANIERIHQQRLQQLKKEPAP